MKNLNSVHLNGLKALEAVGRLGSLQRASEELNVSVGAVSQQIIKAETQLGQPVFERTKRGLVKTEFGGPIFDQLTEGFRILSEAVATAHRRDDCVLTVSTPPIFASRWLVRRLHRFSAHHPKIRLRIDASTELVDLNSSDVDVAIRIGDGQWPRTTIEFLSPQIWQLVCAPKLTAKLITPSDLFSVPILVDRNSYFTWQEWLAAVGFSQADIAALPQPLHSFSEASLCLDAVIAGQGIMLAWQTLVADAVAEGTLVKPFPQHAVKGRSYYFVTAEHARPTAKVRHFKEWLRAELDESVGGLQSQL